MVKASWDAPSPSVANFHKEKGINVVVSENHRRGSLL